MRLTDLQIHIVYFILFMSTDTFIGTQPFLKDSDYGYGQRDTVFGISFFQLT